MGPQVITPNAASEQHRVVLPSNLIEQVLALLFQHCESSEEGVRNVVADCLGKLTLMDAERLLPSLQVGGPRLRLTKGNKAPGAESRSATLAHSKDTGRFVFFL